MYKGGRSRPASGSTLFVLGYRYMDQPQYCCTRYVAPAINTVADAPTQTHLLPKMIKKHIPGTWDNPLVYQYDSASFLGENNQLQPPPPHAEQHASCLGFQSASFMSVCLHVQRQEPRAYRPQTNNITRRNIFNVVRVTSL